MKFDIKIYGTHIRDEMIKEYFKQLPKDTEIIYDDRKNGGNAYYTCKKAWLRPIPKGITHRLCLPDDMQLCDGFLDKIQKVIETHPDKVICLFPFDYNYKVEKYRNQNICDLKTPYFKVNTMSCCGVIFPVQHIKSCIDWIDKNYADQNAIIDDNAMQNYFELNDVKYITTIPSLVQHIGDISLLGCFPIRRTIYFIDDIKNDDINKINWDSKEEDWIAPFYYNDLKDKKIF